ncbi:hypothetical protein [Brevibacillus migulae]|nr:hypothetical protein [Brevibacillus migulae]
MEETQSEQQENAGKTSDAAVGNTALPEVWRRFYEEVQKAIRESD